MFDGDMFYGCSFPNKKSSRKFSDVLKMQSVAFHLISKHGKNTLKLPVCRIVEKRQDEELYAKIRFGLDKFRKGEWIIKARATRTPRMHSLGVCIVSRCCSLFRCCFLLVSISNYNEATSYTILQLTEGRPDNGDIEPCSYKPKKNRIVKKKWYPVFFCGRHSLRCR